MQRHRASPLHVPPPPLRLSGWAFLGLAAFLAAVTTGLYQGGTWLNRQLNPPLEDLKKQVESPINDQEWQSMVTGLEAAAAAWRGNSGIYFRDLNTGREWDYNADRLFPSASLIKVPIMAAVMEKVRLGAITLNTQIKLTRAGRVGGSGSLKWVRDGTSLSVMEIIYKMITESDNTATRMLIDYVGMNYLQTEFRNLGLVHTNICPEGMSLVSGRIEKDNYTTAREMAGMLERIYAGELIDRESSEFMLDVLKHNKSRTRLRKGLPMGWEIGHKTGLLRKCCHDAGIVFSPRGDYVIVVMTSEVPDYTSAKNFIARVASLTYKYYKIDEDFAQGTGGGNQVRTL
ncbi:MAG TPA: class A beta-lactamase-related serine hydrolase [Elusimicrobiales bacterium]|nr:class A beta-lactamase-related serine hydrolase [Elusimicrobiales bacterium]